MSEIIRLGNIYGPNKGSSFAGNVYDVSGLCPTINTAMGGNRQPIILDISYMGVEDGIPRVYKKIAPSLTARQYKDPFRVVEVKE